VDPGPDPVGRPPGRGRPLTGARSARPSGRELAALAAILAVAGLVRCGAPAADVPAEPGVSAAPVLDAFWYLEAASGPVEGVGLEPERAYDLPVWTAVARTWLRGAGVSLVTVHLLGALVSLATVLALWRLVRAGLGPGPALAAAAVLAALYPSVLVGRTTLIYGPMALVLLAAAALWLRGRSCARREGRLACELGAWLAVGVLVVVVRPPALALAGGLALGHLVRSRAPLRLAAVLAGGGALGVLAGRALRPDLWGDLRYRLELHLSEGPWWESVWGLLRLGGVPWSSGAGGAPRMGLTHAYTGSGYFGLAAGALVAAAVGVALAGRRWRRLGPAGRETLALAIGWVATFALGAALMKDRPLRYFAIVGPPVAALAGYGAAACWREARERVGPAPRGRSDALAGLAGGWLAPHTAELLAGRPLAFAPTLGVAALGAVAGAAGVRLAGVRSPSARAARSAGWGLLLVATVPGLVRCGVLLARPTWETRRANALVPRLVGSEAHLAGPFASVLALGNGLERSRAPWIRTEPSELAGVIERLEARGITHLALTDAQARGAALEPRLRAAGVELDLVAVLRVGGPPGWPVLVFRFPWAERVGYRPSAYERRRARRTLVAETDPGLLEARLAALRYRGRAPRLRALLDAQARAAGARGP